jgi:hypothetical protein
MTSPETRRILDKIEEIGQRLNRLESHFSPHSVTHAHPSQEKFAIAEAIVDGLFAAKEKACTFEPSKPCDHCSMCNSRGF